MRAMILHRPGTPLELVDVPIPDPSGAEVLVRVEACAVCRTDLHVVDGDLAEPKLPIIPGHEIVGRIVAAGSQAKGVEVGARIGIPWLGRTCGHCQYCVGGQENLCDAPGFTGYTINGGYAEYTVADSRFCVPIPEDYDSLQAAPLLCAGLIGYRSLVKAGAAPRLGLYGFGAAAHIVIQVARYRGQEVYAFTRPGDRLSQEFALSLGAVWAGESTQTPPVELDAAILFAPVGALVPLALRAVRKGGTVVCAGIHMSDIPSFPYEILWGERQVLSVANLTRADGEAFMQIAPKIPVRTSVELFPLEEANRALEELRSGRIEGAAVLTMGHSETGG